MLDGKRVAEPLRILLMRYRSSATRKRASNETPHRCGVHDQSHIATLTSLLVGFSVPRDRRAGSRPDHARREAQIAVMLRLRNCLWRTPGIFYKDHCVMKLRIAPLPLVPLSES